MAVVGTLVTFVAGGVASAQTIPADPTGGALASAQTSVQTWVMTFGVPVLFGLTLFGIMIKLGRKWLKRAGGAI